MSHVLLVIRHELTERKMLMAGAAAIGLALFMAPLFTDAPARDAWNVTSLYAPIVLGVAIALITASSTIASEMRERRLSFYFGRPLSVTDLWAGKLLAVLLLALVCALLVLLPATVVGSGLIYWLSEGEGGSTALLFGALLAVCAVPIGHAMGVALRARSAWLLADFVAITLGTLLVWSAIRPLILNFALQPIQMIIYVSISAAILALVAGGWFGVARSRVDLRKAHANQSMITSSSLLLIGVGASLFSMWVRAIEIDDVTRLEILPCISSNCQPVVAGTSPVRKDYRGVFAMSGDTFHRLDSAHEVRVSENSRRVVWIQLDSWNPPSGHIRYISEAAPAPVETKIVLDPFSSAIAVSPAGDRIAVLGVEDGLLQVIHLDDERVLRTIDLGDARLSYHLRYLSDDQILCLLSNRRGPLPIGGWTGVVANTSSGETREVRFDHLPYSVDSASEMLLTGRDGEIVVYSIRSWEPIIRTTGAAAVFTPRGLIISRPETREIVVISPEDGQERAYPLPADTGDIALGPVNGDTITLGLTAGGRFHRGRTIPPDAELVSLDLSTGQLTRVAEGLMPVRFLEPAVSGPFFVRDTSSGRQMVRMDPDTAELTVLTGERSEGER